MTINFELLDAAIEDAAKGRDGIVHHQRDWLRPIEPDAEACGTAMCLAGFIGVRAGAKIPAPKWSSHVGEWFFPVWTVDPNTGEYLDDVAFDDAVDIADFATDKAGLTGPQANALFYGENTLEDIRAMVAYLREHPDADDDDLLHLPGNEGVTDA